MARILVVDDDKDILQVVTYIAEQDGHETFQAMNGRQGLEEAISSKPDLIILDIMMPEMDGFTLSKHLLAHPATQNIPVIILTAKGKKPDAFLNATNVHRYVAKPFDPDRLQEQIQMVLNEKPRKAA